MGGMVMYGVMSRKLNPMRLTGFEVTGHTGHDCSLKLSWHRAESIWFWHSLEHFLSRSPKILKDVSILGLSTSVLIKSGSWCIYISHIFTHHIIFIFTFEAHTWSHGHTFQIPNNYEHGVESPLLERVF